MRPLNYPSWFHGDTGNPGFSPTAPAVAAASGATLIKSNVCDFGSISLALFASDNIATAVAKDSATKTVALPVFDDIAHSSPKQVSQPILLTTPQQINRERALLILSELRLDNSVEKGGDNSRRSLGVLPFARWPHHPDLIVESMTATCRCPGLTGGTVRHTPSRPPGWAAC